jgi:hypothetical protein
MKDNPVEKSGNPLSVSTVSRPIESFQIAQPETPQNFEDHSQLKEIPKFTSELKNKEIIKPQTSFSALGGGVKRDFQEVQAPQTKPVFDSNGAFRRKIQKTEEGRQ